SGHVLEAQTSELVETAQDLQALVGKLRRTNRETFEPRYRRQMCQPCVGQVGLLQVQMLQIRHLAQVFQPLIDFHENEAQVVEPVELRQDLESAGDGRRGNQRQPRQVMAVV